MREMLCVFSLNLRIMLQLKFVLNLKFDNNFNPEIKSVHLKCIFLPKEKLFDNNG